MPLRTETVLKSYLFARSWVATPGCETGSCIRQVTRQKVCLRSGMPEHTGSAGAFLIDGCSHASSLALVRPPALVHRVYAVYGSCSTHFRRAGRDTRPRYPQLLQSESGCAPNISLVEEISYDPYWALPPALPNTSIGHASQGTPRWQTSTFPA